uniref:Outer membrane efflux protein n=1 Tax=Magnetococcus massalia (strain MO-1) TaxID=451514 RepID=A0A1S7LHZ1_MAGMO|nr:Outer menbrane protein of unknown function [Candidatus Magnetococcus massalia]
MAFPALGQAKTLHVLLQEALAHSEKLRQATHDHEAKAQEAKAERDGYTPDLDLTLNTGRESKVNASGSNTHLTFKEFDLELSQTLFDFGATQNAVEVSDLGKAKAHMELQQTRQSVLKEAITALLELQRARLVLGYAQEAEKNILNQSNLEQELVDSGAGLTTDVLQAQAQLAGAETRRIRSEGSLIKAQVTFRRLFGSTAEEKLPSSEPLKEHLFELLPETLEGALSQAEKNNWGLKISQLDRHVTELEEKSTFAEELLPVLDLSAAQKWKQNVSGTKGNNKETQIKLELSMGLDLGLSNLNTYRAAQAETLSASEAEVETRLDMEQAVHNAWQELITLRQVAKTSAKQAEISNGFLTLARQERALGNRSLLDLLSGETSYINARSDAASANTDVLVGMVALLQEIGALELDMFAQLPEISDETLESLLPKPEVPREVVDSPGAVEESLPKPAPEGDKAAVAQETVTNEQAVESQPKPAQPAEVKASEAAQPKAPADHSATETQPAAQPASPAKPEQPMQSEPVVQPEPAVQPASPAKPEQTAQPEQPVETDVPATAPVAPSSGGASLQVPSWYELSWWSETWNQREETISASAGSPSPLLQIGHTPAVVEEVVEKPVAASPKGAEVVTKVVAEEATKELIPATSVASVAPRKVILPKVTKAIVYDNTRVFLPPTLRHTVLEKRRAAAQRVIHGHDGQAKAQKGVSEESFVLPEWTNMSWFDRMTQGAAKMVNSGLERLNQEPFWKGLPLFKQQPPVHKDGTIKSMAPIQPSPAEGQVMQPVEPGESPRAATSFSIISREL